MEIETTLPAKKCPYFLVGKSLNLTWKITKLWKTLCENSGIFGKRSFSAFQGIPMLLLKMYAQTSSLARHFTISSQLMSIKKKNKKNFSFILFYVWTWGIVGEELRLRIKEPKVCSCLMARICFVRNAQSVNHTELDHPVSMLREVLNLVWLINLLSNYCLL